MWPQAMIEHRLKSFFAVLIVLGIFFVHVVFVNNYDLYKAKEPLLSFEIPIPGWLKIVWEILLFASATWIYAQNQSSLFLQFYVFAIVLLYLLSWDRTWHMLIGKKKKGSE
ncbi:hypothetical protein TYM08_P1730 [Marinicellulosiphila megalodicopiae]